MTTAAACHFSRKRAGCTFLTGAVPPPYHCPVAAGAGTPGGSTQ
jgi:hypothetical protein